MQSDGDRRHPDFDDPDECFPLTPEPDAALAELWHSTLAATSPEMQRFLTPKPHHAIRAD
jgi:hypothetical protein